MEVSDNEVMNDAFHCIRTWSGNELSWKKDFQKSEDQLDSSCVLTEDLAECSLV